jgi:hypothetical protein
VREKIFCTGPTRAAKAEQNYLLQARKRKLFFAVVEVGFIPFPVKYLSFLSLRLSSLCVAVFV